MIARDMTRGNASKYPDKTAVVVGKNRLNFLELHKRVRRLANALHDSGLKKGELFGVCASPCVQHLEMMHTAIETGMPIAVLNNAVSEEGFAHQVNTGKIRIVIFDEASYDKFEGLRSQLGSLEKAIVLGSERKDALNYEEVLAASRESEIPESPVSYDDLVWVTSSSGTTGLVKLIMRSYETSLALGLRFGYGLNLTAEDVFFNIGSASMALCLARVVGYLGVTFVLADDFSPKSILETIQRERVTKIFCGALFIRSLMNYPDLNKCDLSSVKRVITVGAPLDVSEWRRAIDLFGNIFVKAYGSVEDTPTCFLYPEDIAAHDGSIVAERLGSVGRETPGAHIRVVDDRSNDVKPGELGEFVTKGETLMRGYYLEPEKTGEIIKGGYYYTGDLVKMQEDGYVYFAGRRSEVISVDGKMVLPQDIESVIMRLPQVNEVVVIGLPDEKHGEKVHAVIVLKEKEGLSKEAIAEFCRGRMPDFAIPSSVDFVESLPKGPSGKILKSEIRQKMLSQLGPKQEVTIKEQDGAQ